MSDPAAPVLRAWDLGRTFGGHVALRDLDVEVVRGASLGVVGESGSGKSTFARIVVGLEHATTGGLEVGGLRLDRHLHHRDRRLLARSAQMVFQDPYGSLDRRLSIEQTLTHAVRLAPPGRTATTARVRGLMDQVQLSETLLERRPRELSGGQRQRVAIARALAPEPALLVLDEAVSALDVSVQASILEVLRTIRVDHGTSLLFVSHDLAVVRDVCDDVLVLRDGHVVERGPTDRVLSDPAHPYTQMLLASIPRPGWDPADVVRLRDELLRADAT